LNSREEMAAKAKADAAWNIYTAATAAFHKAHSDYLDAYNIAFASSDNIEADAAEETAWNSAMAADLGARIAGAAYDSARETLESF